MADEDDLYEVFGDFLHEVPEAEDALRAWRRKKALEATRRQERERCHGELPEAIAWPVECRKQVRDGGQ